MVGIDSATNISRSVLLDSVNVTGPAEWFAKINSTMFDGWGFFMVYVFVVGLVFFVVSMKLREGDVLGNAYYTVAFLSLGGFLVRGIEFANGSSVYFLMSDFQMWIFPVLTAILTFVIVAGKKIG